ncbi:MAG: TonB-dependent receptor plug domain-containing protein [Bacteroidota bacterium]
MHKKIVLLSFLLTFASTIAISQVNNYVGYIVDIFENPMREVSIINERTQEKVLSNCKGRFIIAANKGDRLTFTKENYLPHRKFIKSRKKMDVLLNFDTEIIKSKIYKDHAVLHDFESPLDEVFCQVLFIIDGNPFNPNDSSGRFLNLDPKDISKVNVLKGQRAADMFGNAGRNGVVFIHTACSLNKFPGVYEE